MLRAFCGMCVWILSLLGAGCTPWDRALPIPPEVSETGVATRITIPLDLDVNPDDDVVEPGTPGPQPTEPPASGTRESAATTFTLPDAIAFALHNSPRLRSAQAAIQRARGQEQVAFAPFLPQIDLLGQYGIVSSTLAPGVPGNEGFILADGTGTRRYAQTELGLEWILYDFGRTVGGYRQALARSQIADAQALRADQTVEFDVADAYLNVLLARAFHRVQVDAVRRAEAILDDTSARSAGGVALREDVLRAEVQLSESREALIVAREAEFDALARLNNAMGRNAALPLEVVDLGVEPPLPGELAELLERAAAERPEVRLVRQQTAAAQEDWQVARAGFLPRIFVRAAAGNTQGEHVITGWQEGAGLHLEAPIFAGGRHIGELHSAEANVQATVADAQTILDEISLQVNLAYRGAVASKERIALSRTAVAQARENQRLVAVRYRNGDATPTDIVDSEAALTRSQQRFFSATYTYLAALARVDYVVGRRQGGFSAGTKTREAVSDHLPFHDTSSRLDKRVTGLKHD